MERDDHDRFKGNPAARVKKRLPQGVEPVEVGHGSLPWELVPALYSKLTAINTPASYGLRFLLLCCTPRAAEIVEADWSEIKGDQFGVPAERMKSGKARIIPLCQAALELLANLPNKTGYLFPTKRAGKQVGEKFIPFAGHMQKDAMLLTLQTALMTDGKKMADPVNGKPIDIHGLRATFSTWVSAHRSTVYDIDAREMALDHAIGDAVVRAYDRADLLDQRRDLAERWAGFVTGKQAVALQQAA
jgi:integrase